VTVHIRGVAKDWAGTESWPYYLSSIWAAFHFVVQKYSKRCEVPKATKYSHELVITHFPHNKLKEIAHHGHNRLRRDPCLGCRLIDDAFNRLVTGSWILA
jgi:hypothetical protein